MILQFVRKSHLYSALPWVLLFCLPFISGMSPALPNRQEPGDWKGLLGKYEVDEGQYFYLREKDGQLEILLPLQEAIEQEMLYFNYQFYAVVPLQKLGTDSFQFPPSSPLPGETIQFTRDAQGFGISARAGTATFERNFYAPEKGETFKIPLLWPVDELRPLSLAVNPPEERGDFLPPDLVEVDRLDSTIRLDIRYATDDNFMGAGFYDEPRVFLQRPAAEALVRVNQQLHPFGFGLVVHDAYRPWYVTWMFWEATPEEMRNFVADPQKGSRHNRGGAVDVSMYDLRSGELVDFGGDFDEFSERSFIYYPAGSSGTRWVRELLAFYMIKEGYSRNPDEWWHFDFKGWEQYPILNMTFDQIESHS